MSHNNQSKKVHDPHPSDEEDQAHQRNGAEHAEDGSLPSKGRPDRKNKPEISGSTGPFPRPDIGHADR